ncbi:HAMP domain-containing histidine kinase [Candidatus Saccharibacteria bacterium]|nr:HAMP domain-containing histidine kinase [Candidatus Saccharibacteria bacterium]
MFRKLRNKFILTNFVISTVILLISFGAIYLFAYQSSERRASVPDDAPSYKEDVSNIINERIRLDRSSSLDSLLVNMFATGIVIEVVVVVVSYFLAERSIRPIQEAYESQKLFIANASHEIKTPLAAIQANLEAADITGNHWIDNVALETEKLAALNSELLTLAKSDITDEIAKTEPVKLKDLVIKNVKSVEPRLKSKTITIKGKNPPLTLAKADFVQLFNIILDNAIKYSDQTISIEISDKSVKVKNDGATIPKEKLPHIFDRFYQVDKSSDGVGLGLSIAKSLAEKNKWTLSVSSAKSTTEFKIVL